MGAQAGRVGGDRRLDHSEWNQAMRGETEAQAADRHFSELLQELRVAQTGVQILFAFLLALVGAVHLAASLVVGPWATLLAAGLAGLFASLWFVVPLVHRARRGRDG